MEYLGLEIEELRLFQMLLDQRAIMVSPDSKKFEQLKDKVTLKIDQAIQIQRGTLKPVPANLDGQKMRNLADILKPHTQGLVFALWVMPANAVGIASYISNGQRNDMMRWMMETLERFMDKGDIPTPEAG